jgi:hypothetical protein
MLATVQWFSPGLPVSSTNKTEILLKVALSTIKQTTNGFIRSPFVWGVCLQLDKILLGLCQKTLVMIAMG